MFKRQHLSPALQQEPSECEERWDGAQVRRIFLSWPIAWVRHKGPLLASARGLAMGGEASVGGDVVTTNTERCAPPRLSPPHWAATARSPWVRTWVRAVCGVGNVSTRNKIRCGIGSKTTAVNVGNAYYNNLLASCLVALVLKIRHSILPSIFLSFPFPPAGRYYLATSIYSQQPSKTKHHREETPNRCGDHTCSTSIGSRGSS